jgi:phospholipid transport system substrate-binding protein
MSSQMSIRNTLLVVMALLFNATAMADTHPAEVLMRNTSDEILAEIRQHGDQLLTDRSRLYGLIEEKVVPHFDLRRMSQYVVGKHWRLADRDQRSAFARQFKTLLIRTYGGALTSFPEFEINYLPIRSGDNPGKVTTRMEIRLADGRSIPVDYRMHNKDGDWKVYDVVVDGVSLISTYRSSFSVYINKSGLDGLIDELRARNAISVTVSDNK